MKDSKPDLERRMQLQQRNCVNAYLYKGWKIIKRDPMQLFKGRQVATIEGGKVNIENVVPG